MAHGRTRFGGAVVTPTEYAGYLTEAIDYIARLRCRTGDPDGRTIALEIAMLPDSERARYISHLIADHPHNSREYEIGRDLQAILLGENWDAA